MELARTGGPFPGEQTCGTSDCHNNTPNSGLGSISIQAGGVPISEFRYTPGDTVEMIVRVQDPAQQRWGFQVTARDADDGCLSVGSFGSSMDALVRILESDGNCGGGREFAAHTFAKAGSEGEFSFNWTAPAVNVGPIVFAAAGNAANGNNLRTGDMIYTTSQSVEVLQVGEPQDPLITEGGIVLANLLPTVTTISPHSIISVFGQNFSTETVSFPNLDGNGNIDTILGGSCLLMNDEALPIFAITPGQINAQVSAAKVLGPASFTVVANCGTVAAVGSAPLTVEMVTVEEATPAFFLYPPLSEGGLIAARFNADNGAVAPDGMFNDQFGPSRPAKPGDIIVLYGTGWGETSSALEAGELATGPAEVLPGANPMVSFGGLIMDPADVFYVGVTPQAAGLYQLAIRVPAGAQPGSQKVVLTVYGKSTPLGPVVPVVAP